MKSKEMVAPRNTLKTAGEFHSVERKMLSRSCSQTKISLFASDLKELP